MTAALKVMRQWMSLERAILSFQRRAAAMKPPCSLPPSRRCRVHRFRRRRKKAEALKSSLAGRGISEERLARLKAPAGLDLGAITPEEIAISILAEIVAVQRRKDSRDKAVVA
jgi:hypothetical protein